MPPYIIKLELEQPLPYPFEQQVWWGKCDMVATVSFARLDLFHTERVQGKRRYLKPKLSTEEFTRVQQGVLAVLGMAGLTRHVTPRQGSSR